MGRVCKQNKVIISLLSSYIHICIWQLLWELTRLSNYICSVHEGAHFDPSMKASQSAGASHLFPQASHSFRYHVISWLFTRFLNHYFDFQGRCMSKEQHFPMLAAAVSIQIQSLEGNIVHAEFHHLFFHRQTKHIRALQESNLIIHNTAISACAKGGSIAELIGQHLAFTVVYIREGTIQLHQSHEQRNLTTFCPSSSYAYSCHTMKLVQFDREKLRTSAIFVILQTCSTCFKVLIPGSEWENSLILLSSMDSFLSPDTWMAWMRGDVYVYLSGLVATIGEVY